MKIELVNAINYEQLKNNLLNDGFEIIDINYLIEELKQKEKERRASIVAASGRLSRYPGNVFEMFDKVEDRTLEKNNKTIENITGMGHESILDHDYLVFKIQDVSPVIEQTIIAERFSSFTIKSRREVDFSNVGFYIPDFHDKDGNILENNDELKQKYTQYMKSLFESYSYFEKSGIPKEDARFVLPYCYYSNIVMGVDAHTLKDMIIKYTKTKYANIQELREFGEYLYQIAKENVPYIIPLIDKVCKKDFDDVDRLLSDTITKEDYQILDSPKLLNYSKDIDKTIVISALMRRYQYNYEQALKIYNEIINESPELVEKIMRTITFESDKAELAQVNFEFQIPLSFAVLTHLTRHRTHQLLIPDFVPNIDLMQYKIPPKIQKENLDLYCEIFIKNQEMYNYFKNQGVCEEDLVYFTLSGNMVNVVTQMDGKTLEHILGLRECTKAQWETREMAVGLHNEINKVVSARVFTKLLGATCTTQGYCKEGKESCGKIKTLVNSN